SSCLPQPTAPPAESLSALDCLSQDFVSPSKGAAVQKSSAAAPVSCTAPVSAVNKPEAKKSSSEKPKDSAPQPAQVRPLCFHTYLSFCWVFVLFFSLIIRFLVGLCLSHLTVTSPQGGSMSLDALSALEDLLPSAEPPKPQPAVRPEDIVSEATVEEDKAVRVGERDDTLPPEYRPKPGEISKLPAPKPQPSLDDTEALDILSGDFSSSCAPSTQHIKVSSCSDSCSRLTSLFPVFSCQLAAGADSALDALSDSLKDIAPTPQPEPPMPTNIVKEKQLEEERLIKMGERDDTLPPEYRPTEEELMVQVHTTTGVLHTVLQEKIHTARYRWQGEGHVFHYKKAPKSPKEASDPSSSHHHHHHHTVTS
uniref:Calpastatin n=1 Tax=Neogobius melanostomus TaxID=47308 RepID=A0A8C6UFX2_9GOBI